MADEEMEVTEESAEDKANAEAEAALKATDPAKVATHPAVLATAGSHCTVEGCNWTFGDPVNGIEPHPTVLVTQKPLPIIGPKPPESPAPKESTAKCEPVHIADTCGNCGWSAAESIQPHPVRV